MSAQGNYVHDDDKFTFGKIAGKTFLVSEARALGYSTSIPPRFGIRHASTQTVSTFDFVRSVTTDVGKRCEYRGPGGWQAHVYLQ